MQQLNAIMLGAGARGTHAYGPFAEKNPNELVFIGVAEPDEQRRRRFIKSHPRAAGNSCSSWEELLAKPKLAEIAFICTQDNMHAEPAKQAIAKGYDLFLEKPISPNLHECLQLNEQVREKNISTAVGHVLRYTDFFQNIKRIIDSGAIGKLISIQHNENVGHIHMSHSFVRGSWRNLAESSPMILAKSCHDLDILQWLIGSSCKKLSSFGSLSYFCKENAPEGSPKHCLDGCPVMHECPYYAPQIYINNKYDWARTIQVDKLTTSEQYDFLRSSPYGVCVFHSDNDVVDHQVVNMEFENGVTVVFTMCGFTYDTSRTIKIMGSKGEIRGAMEKNIIEVRNFQTECISEVHIPSAIGLSGHGNGDYNLVCDFVAHCRDKTQIREKTPLRDCILSHMMAFAAEESRLTATTIDMGLFMQMNL